MRKPRNRARDPRGWSIVFLAVACVSALFGFTSFIGDAYSARLLFWFAIALFVASLAMSFLLEEPAPARQRNGSLRSDSHIKRDVEAELEWDRAMDARDIIVAVKDGVVTLTGFVPDYVQKIRAEAVVKRVAGVIVVANDIQVRVPSENERPDPEIARDVVGALRSELPNSHQNLKATVRDGWVTLEGTVVWDYQRSRAKEAVERVKGVKGVISNISLKPRVGPDEIKSKIEEAFLRNAEIEAGRITVEANGGVVVLKGNVHSWAEKNEAERTAWRAPGVTMVENRIKVAA